MSAFLASPLGHLIILVVEIGVLCGVLLGAIAYFTYAERKVLAYSQLRKGPNVVGPFGLFQPIADGLKLLMKETVIPSGANRIVFVAAPMATFSLALVAWAVIPAAQMVSYEVSIGFVLVTVLLCAGSLNLTDIVMAQRHVWFVIPLLPMAVVFFISGLAETNRAPFDLPEGESELVAGYFVEYSAMTFALFYLGEYGNMIMVSAMTAILFLGGWLPPASIAPFTWVPAPIWFLLKTVFMMFCILWVRATFPRFRYDQLMRLGWKVFLPFTLFWLVLTAGVLTAFGWVPVR